MVHSFKLCVREKKERKKEEEDEEGKEEEVQNWNFHLKFFQLWKRLMERWEYILH